MSGRVSLNAIAINLISNGQITNDSWYGSLGKRCVHLFTHELITYNQV